jgi:hypothetical protein
MDVSAITEALKDFCGTHKTAFSDISQRQSQLLELAAIVGIQEHYRSNGYVTTIIGTVDGTFVVKTGTRGHPARYSRIRVEKDGVAAELHMNLLVRGAHDEGVYCVDVGVVQPLVVPEKAARKQKWICVENESLITFGEVKRLVVYPMLLAQFVGIVHEIKPGFLADPAPEGFDRYRHLPPVLMALGHFSGNSAAIVRAYEGRSIRLCIAENFDVRIAAHRKGTCASPLYWDVEVEKAASSPALASLGA